MGHYITLFDAVQGQIELLKRAGEEIDPGHWQGYDTEGHPDLVTEEILNVNFTARIPDTVEKLVEECQPNMPWAETEFLERVGGEPHNPHHSLEQWPWWQGQTGKTMHEGMFSHTYSERFWPRQAGESIYEVGNRVDKFGIRYEYGDLNDVINLLRKYPHTRQATFPIFFPEDTGAVHGGRIPCTLHYHFLLRNDRLHLWYPIRSCDAVRHFRDDVYMAGRLCQWVITQIAIAFEEWKMQDNRTMSFENPWRGARPGNLYFTAYSFHVHRGDKHLL